MTDLIDLNDRLLGEVDELLAGPVDGHYSSPCQHVFSSSIGQHIRHCLEHYEEFLRALRENHSLDYENRPRDPEVEIDPVVARKRIEAVRAAFQELLPGSQGLVVRDHGTGLSSGSSVARELQFLVSHTVHHFALISVIASTAGLNVPADFGVAPTTLKFRESA
jgi:uncharacterized damage-inducible protein DinB